MKSAPLEAWAAIIFCASSKIVGIYLKLIDIINAKSSELNPILFKGLNKLSNPCVKSVGFVVSVSIVVKVMIIKILTTTNIDISTPFS